MKSKYKYLFGPVPSRRLGKSLGVDIVPLKTCTQNCVYCQLGVNGVTTTERKPYVDIDEVLDELKGRISEGLDADFITLSGSGEPTLNSDIGILIDKIKAMTDTPVAVITNGTMLGIPEAAADICKADAVLPSLDAGDQETFAEMNCPHTGITFEGLVEGLIKFREAFKGQIWLEVFFCEDINTSDEQVKKIKSVINRIRPDKVQLNTAVRPTADSRAKAVSPEKLTQIAEIIGNDAEVIASFPERAEDSRNEIDSETVLSMLRRRPCSIQDISSSLNAAPGKVRAIIEELLERAVIYPDIRDGRKFYKLK